MINSTQDYLKLTVRKINMLSRLELYLFKTGGYRTALVSIHQTDMSF